VAKPSLDDMAWTREPGLWTRLGSTTVAWTSSPASDFWRYTGGVAPKHDGNSLLAPVGEGDFAMEADLCGILTDQYDQFGVFVEIDEQNWVKAGIELDDGLWLSTVATKERSDWAREPAKVPAIALRVLRHDDTVEAFVGEGGEWRMIRELTLAGAARVGVYSCSPKGEGFSALARIAVKAGI
jgi:regulation of enolase protein 1 (concanavalin A-like superfamily)